MADSSALQRLLRPASIAVVGGDLAAEVIRQCDRLGFSGEIWPVHPNRKQMEGRECFPSVADLPGGPDAAFVGISRERTIEVVRALAKRGAGGVVCHASGYAEVGGAGIALQENLVDAVGDMAMVGPNCYGVLNYLDGVALWPDQHGGERVEKGVAIITQSGNIGISLTMQRRSLSIGYLISAGNMAGIAMHEYIEALIEDDRITAIGLHIEGLREAAAFSAVAIRALAKGVPIVALKTGVSERGRQIAMSHTSALASADQLFDALFERVGIPRVRTLPQFLETLKFLSVIGPLPGNQIASISCSGGEAALVADLADSLGLSIAPLVEAQREGLQAVLGDKVAVGNPLDYHTYIWGQEEAQYRCFSAMLLGAQEITLKILDYPRTDRCDDVAWIRTVRAFSRAVAERGGRAALVSTLQETLPAEARDLLIAQGIAPMQGLEECLIAIRGAAVIYQKQKQYPEIAPLLAVSQQNGPEILLNEARSKQALQEYGIPIPRFAICTAADAARAAQEIGFPVAVKLLSEVLVHKSDVGGVDLNLRGPKAVQEAVGRMLALGDHFLVEAMAPAPLLELILGVTRDPQFGLALVIGAGGVLVELVRDHQTLLLPVTRAEVAKALSRLKTAALLDGYRGQPPADKEAIVAAVMSLARFAENHAAELLEVDINPLFVFPEGRGVLAVDASIRRMSGE